MYIKKLKKKDTKLLPKKSMQRECEGGEKNKLEGSRGDFRQNDQI